MVNRAVSGLLLVGLYLTQAGHNSCSGDLLHDSGFDLWCGDELCSWQVEKGDVRQATTWHADDLGVELVGDDVVISQLTDASNTPCVLFDLVADIDPGASVDLEMDLYDDGEIDFTERLPTASWDSLSYLVRMPERFQGIRFRLRKSGGGHAVLAQIRAREELECGGARLAQPVSPLGASCWGVDGNDSLVLENDWCASGSCALTRPGVDLSPAVCSECADDADCPGAVCGVESQVASFLQPYRTCVDAASRGLGELCMEDGECATGVCCAGVCSDCCSDDDRGCDGGGACEPSPSSGANVAPEQCDPGGGTRASGAACLGDADCAGGRCSGGDPLTVCLADGRLCDADSDCPPDGSQEEGEFGSCADIGVTRGTCD